MAYVAQRSSNNVKRQIQIGDEIIDVDVNVGKISMEYNKSMNKILRLQSEESTPENMEAIGNATIEMFNLVLGEKNTDKLLEYYEQDYVEMLEMMVPFIIEEIGPAIKEYAEKKNQVAATKYKQNQRKKFGVN